MVLMTQRRRIACGAACAMVLAPAVCTSSADARALKLTVALPKPGHVAVELVRAKVGATAGRKVRVRFPHAGSLPSSVKVLFARKTIRRKHSTTLGLLLVIVNRADAKARAAQADNLKLLEEDKNKCGLYGLCMLLANNPPSYPRPEGYYSQSKNGVSGQWADSQSAGPYGAHRVGRVLTDLFSGVAEGDNAMVFENTNTPIDPNLDTGHYDDGHSFGWNVKTQTEEHEVLIDLVKDLGEEQPSAILPALEVAGGVDLNGNGAIDSPSQAGTGIDTTVGPPQFG